MIPPLGKKSAILSKFIKLQLVHTPLPLGSATRSVVLRYVSALVADKVSLNEIVEKDTSPSPFFAKSRKSRPKCRDL